MRNLRYRSKFTEMLFLLKKQFPDYDITWSFTKAGDYEVVINGFKVDITYELLDDMTVTQIWEYIVSKMNKEYPKRNKK